MNGFKRRIIIFYIQFLEFFLNNYLICQILSLFSKSRRICNLFLKPTKIKNIAFIMDGNRRYARNKNISDIESKRMGFDKMLEIAEYCSKIHVKDVSFFAFSIANFERSKTEVNNIMNLIIENENNTLRGDFCPKIRIIGRKEMIQSNIKEIFKNLSFKTSEYKDINFNIFFAYSSKDEIESGEIMYEKNVDLLIRTSGEKRLSDFLLRQCCKGTNIFFCNNKWPELSIIQLRLILYKCELEQKYFY